MAWTETQYPLGTATQVGSDWVVNGNLMIKGPLPWVDVRAYGASPSASAATNDAAFANAIAASPAEGGMLFVPPGSSYLISQPIAVGNKIINIVGAGEELTRIRLADAANVDMVTFGTGTATPIGAAISGITLDGNKANQTAAGHVIKINGAREVYIHRVAIVNAKLHGIFVTGTGAFTGSAFISFSRIVDSGQNGITVGPNYSTTHIKNNYVAGTLANFADINVTSGSEIFVVGNNLDASLQYGLRMTNVSNAIIHGNYIQSINVSGITIDGGGRGHSIVGNTFYAIGGGASGQAIQIADTDSAIVGNTIDSTGPPLGGQTGNGIVELTGADRNVIAGNVFLGPGFAGAKIVFIGANTRARDNPGFVTEANVLSSTFAIDSTGLKTVTIAHGLSYTPSVEQCQLTVLQNTAVDDWAYNLLKVVSTDATNVTAKINVSTASVTGGATARLGLRAQRN